VKATVGTAEAMAAPASAEGSGAFGGAAAFNTYRKELLGSPRVKLDPSVSLAGASTATLTNLSNGQKQKRRNTKKVALLELFPMHLTPCGCGGAGCCGCC
tara:strand:+ start:274 stop:573 length:300 start_codon:yes stop_codon:yes gene_type:complete